MAGLKTRFAFNDRAAAAMKEADIRPRDLLEEYLRLSAADIGLFFAREESLVARSCPGCGTAAPAPEFEKNGFPLARCPSCRSLFASRVPAPEKLAAFYRDSPSQKFWAEVFFPAVAEARRMNIFRPRVAGARDLVVRYGAAPKCVVDVGAGAGMFLEECRTAGFGEDWRAVEPNEISAAVCRKKGFATLVGFGADAAATWTGVADCVTSFEVLEHLADPEGFLRDLAAIVRPGGILLVSGLCGTGFDILSLGKLSNAVFPPHHLSFLSRDGARALLARCGLEELAFLTPGRLDVDIVRNTCADHPDIITDPFLRHLLFSSDEAQRARFQDFLTEAGLSSHMWIVARRP